MFRKRENKHQIMRAYAFLLSTNEHYRIKIPKGINSELDKI